MDVQLLKTIPHWKSRLQAKMLEKQAFWGAVANVGKAALTMGGRGAKVGAAVGGGLGGLDYMTSNDPNKSLLGSVGGGALKGGALGFGAGAVGGAGLRAAPGLLGSGSKHFAKATKWQKNVGLGGTNVDMPGWALKAGSKIKDYAGPTMMGK